MGVLGVDRQTWQDLLPQEEQSLPITPPLQCSFPPRPLPCLDLHCKGSLSRLSLGDTRLLEGTGNDTSSEGFPPTPPPISLYGPVRPSPLTQRPGLQTRGPGPWASPTQALRGVGSETVGEMLCRAQLIGPGVRSALGGPMEEVSIQEALARGEGSSLLMWKAGAGDNDVLNARERLP